MGVHDQRRRQQVGAGDGSGVRVAPTVARVAARAGDFRPAHLAERLRVDHVVAQKAEAAEHAQLLAGVPVHLGVEPVTVEDVTPGRVVVARQQAAGHVGQRRQVCQLPGNRAAARRRDDPVRECGSVGPGRIPGQRIVDRIRGPGHVAALDRGGRHGGKQRGVLAVVGPLVAQEVEQLLLLDRPAQRRAELVVDQLGLLPPRRYEEGLGLQAVAAVVFKHHPVQVVGAALGLHIDGGAAGQTGLGVETAGSHVHRFDGLQRGHVRGLVRQPDVDGLGAVNLSTVNAVAGAVDVESQGARRVRRNGVLVPRRAEPRHRDEEVLVVPAQRHREIVELVPVHLGPHFRPVGLEHGRGAGHRHRLRHRPDLQRYIHAGNAVGSGRDGGFGEGGEPLLVDPQRVAAGRDGREAVAPHLIGYGLAGLLGLGVGDRDVGAGDRGIAGVLHVADDRTIKHLRLARLRRDQRPQNGQTQENALQISFSHTHLLWEREYHDCVTEAPGKCEKNVEEVVEAVSAVIGSDMQPSRFGGQSRFRNSA